MTQTKYKFTRAEVRLPAIEQQIAGSIQSIFCDSPISFKLWDITSIGIGILAAEELTAGEHVVILFEGYPGEVMKCQVAWSQPYKLGADLHRAGLKVVDHEIGILADLIDKIENDC